MSKYQAEWKPYEKNEEFWKEVMLNRTITALVFDENGIDYFLLDSNEKIFVDKSGGRLHIQD